MLVAGKPMPASGQQAGASWDRVSAQYLQHLGVKLVRGRHLSEADNENTESVAVVNEGFVARFFKADEDPSISISASSRWCWPRSVSTA